MNKLREVAEKISARILYNKKLIVFESYPDFSDSTMAVYNYLLEKNFDQKYKLLWCVHSAENLKNKRFNTFQFKKGIKFFFYTFSASYVIYSHSFIGNTHSEKQKRVFILHGMSFKDAGKMFWPADYNSIMFTLSDMHSKQLITQMPGSENKTIALGFPRNDAMFNSNQWIYERLNISPHKKLIVWLPTFRRSKCELSEGRNDYGESQKEEFGLLNGKTLKKIDDVLKDNNCYLIVKYHPSQDISYISTEDFQYENILSLTAVQFNAFGVGVYDLLSRTDALIADFSSVYIDFLLRDKPIAFDITDISAYSNGLGFSVENPIDYMPGQMIRSDEDIVSFIKDVANGRDEYKEKRKKIVQLVHDYTDSHSTERIVNYLQL